ncbi:FAD/NAD-P-binding domain-containing protein [Gloeopeniophorella convolvens]|nr:FAD/NAD-P-binding domain-containing protein [Gloeopeniophorella convolvens]
MRKVVSSALLAASVSQAFQLPFNIGSIWSQGPLPEILPGIPDVEPVTRSPRVAIIGAGAGGSSAAFWIGKAKERYGLDIGIDIYERSNYIGGRSTTVYPYNNSAYEPIELGASIFVSINKNLWRATDEFNLTRYGFEDEDGDMGIWDGESFLLTQGTVGGTIGSWLDSLKVLWRYGYHPPTRATKLLKSMTDKFVKLYVPGTPRWSTIEDLSNTFEWNDLISQTGAEYFESHGVSAKFTTEMIEAATRVNYAQNVDSLHALEAMCSLAADGANSVKGGNWLIFEKFVEESKARVFLNTDVTSISRRSDAWSVTTSKKSRDYDAVILAAPYHTSGIALAPALSSAIPQQPYIRLHVTLLSTTAETPNPEYFGLKAGAKAPTTVLTTLDGARRGGVAPEFNSLTYHGPVKLAKNEDHDIRSTDEWVVKIFSMEPVSDEWLANMFQNQVSWVLRKEWDAYPVLPPTTKFPPVKLDDGLFYVNAFEPFISTMETETIASRNIVDALLHEKFNASICPPSDSDDIPSDFVYGWDCL